jgi:hypothetical protein
MTNEKTLIQNLEMVFRDFRNQINIRQFVLNQNSIFLKQFNQLNYLF